MARPTDYSEEVLEKAKTYLEECNDETEQEIIGLSAKGTELYKNKQIVHLPSVVGLAQFLGVSRKTIYNWGDQHEEFLHILEDVLGEQEKRLLEKGLSGDYNSNIVKLALGKHGYTDKTDITSNGKPILIADEE